MERQYQQWADYELQLCKIEIVTGVPRKKIVDASQRCLCSFGEFVDRFWWWWKRQHQPSAQETAQRLHELTDWSCE